MVRLHPVSNVSWAGANVPASKAANWNEAGNAALGRIPRLLFQFQLAAFETTMTDFLRHVERLADVFFNGRKAEPEQAITITELIRRKTSTVRVGGKFYKVVVAEMELKDKT